MFAEHLNDIARTSVRTGDIDHRLVHAHIAHYRAAFSAYIDLTAVVREAAIETIRITDRDDGDGAVFGKRRMTTVTDRLTSFNGLDGEDSGLERADIA